MRNLIIDTKKENLKGIRRIIIFNSDSIEKIILQFPNTSPSTEIYIEIKSISGTVTTLTSNKDTSAEKEEHLSSLLVKIYEKVFSDGSLRNQLASEKFGL